MNRADTATLTPNNMKTENYDGIITWNRTSGSSGLEGMGLVIFLGSAVFMLFGEPARSLVVSVQHIEQGAQSIKCCCWYTVTSVFLFVSYNV